MLTQGVKTKKRAPFEFERNGPINRPPGGHKADMSLSVNRPREYQSRNLSNSSTQLLHTKSQKTITLDTLFIVDLLGSSDFEKCTEIDGSSKKLNAIDLSAMKQLTNVAKADFSDNQLPLEPFAVMPSLESLDLSCNSLKSFNFQSSESMSGDDRAWKSLNTLNLSFNMCSRCITDLQLIPLLTNLNLSNNSLTSLPSNLMHFTCLTTFDLSGNMLNGDSAFFSLATIPSLQILVLDNNQIMHIPKFQYGFEALQQISLKNNQIEIYEDFDSLADLDQLENVDILGNPICLRPKHLVVARQTFAAKNINLTCDEPPPAVKRSLAGPLRTVQFDPLTLPTFTQAHIKALNQKNKKLEGSPKKKTRPSSEEKQPMPIVKPAQLEDDVFMTAFGSKADEEPQKLDIQPTELPQQQEEEQVITSVWNEVPVVQLERRVQLTPRRRNDFITTFKKLEFIVSHPDVRLKPRESPSMESDDEEALSEQVPDVIIGKPPVVAKKKKEVATKLAARTEYTKTEITQMLQSMEERLSIVERDLQVADESGQSAVDIALDQKNFANLHKQYETIRAELINTLNT